MLTAMAYSLIAYLGFSAVASGAKLVSDSEHGASASADASASDVFENSRLFSEKYQLDSVLNTDSIQPYISSNEITRPAGGGKDDKKIGKRSFFGGFGLGSALGLSSSDSANRFWLVVGLLVGGYVLYKVVK